MNSKDPLARFPPLLPGAVRLIQSGFEVDEPTSAFGKQTTRGANENERRSNFAEPDFGNWACDEEGALHGKAVAKLTRGRSVGRAVRFEHLFLALSESVSI